MISTGLMEELYDQHLLSVFVEGGAKLHSNHFLSRGCGMKQGYLRDKMSFGQGVEAPVMKTEPVESLVFRKTSLQLFRNHSGVIMMCNRLQICSFQNFEIVIKPG